MAPPGQVTVSIACSAPAGHAVTAKTPVSSRVVPNGVLPPVGGSLIASESSPPAPVLTLRTVVVIGPL